MSNILDQAAIDQVIHKVFRDTYIRQYGEASVPTLSEDTVLLGTGLDSLGFAILVTKLEQELGYDPFSIAEEPFYPRTYQELRDFYLAYQIR